MAIKQNIEASKEQLNAKNAAFNCSFDASMFCLIAIFY